MCWLLADLIFAVTIIALLLHKPAGYEPFRLGDQATEGPQPVSQYLTYLYSELHNGVQSGRPFELDLDEAGTNELIASADWPQQTDNIAFSTPKARFDITGVTVMGTANVEGVDLVVTIKGIPLLLNDGRFILHIDKIKIGAMNITLAAKPLAKKMYNERLGYLYTDPNDLNALIAASLLDDKPFDPVFTVENKHIRLQSITLAEDLIRLRFIPVE